MRALFILFLIVLALPLSPAGFVQADHPTSPEKLGTINFSA